MIDYLSLMLRLQAMGVNGVLVNEHKIPVHKWEPLQSRLLTPDEIRDLRTSRRQVSVYDAGVQGIGVVHGIGCWRSFDLDDCAGFAPVAVLLDALELPADYPWVVRTGSGQGWSIWIRCADEWPGGMSVLWGQPVEAGAFDHVELRLSKRYSLLPPSKHPSGGRYVWHGAEPSDAPAWVSRGNIEAAFLAIARPCSPLRKARANQAAFPAISNQNQTELPLVAATVGLGAIVIPSSPEPAFLPKAIYQRRTASVLATGLENAIVVLKGRGYHENGDWLNGPCLFPENHKNGDVHPSSGVNMKTGVHHCFVCGAAPLSSVLHRLVTLDVPPEPPREDVLFLFAGGAKEPNDPSDVRTELNIAVALFNKGAYQTARFYPILLDHARRHDGQHTYTTAELVELGAAYGMTRDQVNKAIKQMVDLKFLRKRGRGLYQRVSVLRVQQRLGITEEFGAIWLPRAAYTGTPSDYFAALLLVIEHCLPGALATATIGQTAGVSPNTIYRHENRQGIVRKANVRRTLAAATLSFAKAYHAQGDYAGVIGREDAWGQDDVEYGARKLAGPGGQVWGWQQLPSTRILPNLDILRHGAESSL